MTLFTGSKKCQGCGEVKPIDQFPRYSHRHARNCSACRSVIQKDTMRGLSDLPQAMGQGVKMSRLASHSYDLWSNAFKRAASCGREFTITRRWVFDAVAAFCSTTHHSFDRDSPFRPSLDRVARKGGYTPENVRVVWLIENLARNRFTDEQVIEFCRRKLGLL